MSARSILAKASAAGIRIRALDGNLSLRGDEQAIAEILPEVTLHKYEILVLLAPGNDDRVFCSDCQGLVRGRCQPAAQGLMADTYRGYSPVPDVLHRCSHFLAKRPQ